MFGKLIIPKDVFLAAISFEWKDRDSTNRLYLHNITVSEALAQAKDMGFVPGCWYRPWTWENVINLEFSDRLVTCSNVQIQGA